MFNDSKYTRWYTSIIAGAKNREREEYSERHHIIPRSLGGSDAKDNLVRLTFREHFLVHWLLTKMFDDEQNTRKMKHAMTRMSWTSTKHGKNRVLSSWYFETIKIARQEARIGSKWSAETRSKIMSQDISRMKGKHHSEEAKIKIREANLKIWSDPEKRKAHSVAQQNRDPILEASRRNKISVANVGHHHTEELKAHWSKTRSGIGNPNYGKPRSEETKRKIKESRLRFEALKRNQNV